MDKVVYNGGCFQSFWGTPPTGLQGEFLTLQDLYQITMAAFLSPLVGAITAVYMHYNESRYYLGAQVEEERDALHLWLLVS